jgi:predicted DNA-binding transcriptional regulator AlpA
MRPASETAATIQPLLAPRDIAKLLGCSVRLLERMRSGGAMPPPDAVIGARLPRWKVESIGAWIERGCQK